MWYRYDPSGLHALGAAIRRSATLRRLDVSKNALGVSYVDGARVASVAALGALADAAAAAPALRELVISYNSLSQHAGSVLGAAVGRSRLASVDASGNLVGLKGAKALCEAAASNPNLAVVDMRFNSLNEAAKAAIREAEGAFGTGIGRLRVEL